jgi:DNA-binding NarL/FixJ family response regulator
MGRVLLAEQVDVLREALAAFLTAADQPYSVGEARNSAELLQMARHGQPWDVILLDSGLARPRSLELLQLLGDTCPAVPVIMILPGAGPAVVQLCVRTGAAGCLDQDVVLCEVSEAIEQVLHGHTYFSPSLLGASLQPA